MKDLKEVLNNSIELHWLRPDNALWVYSFYTTFASEIQQAITSKKATMDLGCGDGTTSFILLDGKFNKSFDVFCDVQADKKNSEVDTKRSESGSLLDQDGDFYNSYSESWTKYLKIDEQSPYKFNAGLDWKDSLVKKAASLGIYDETYVHDANFALPFKDESYEFIFSTIIYWLANPQNVLKDIGRILKKDGVFAFSCPKENITNYTLKSMISSFNYPEIDRLDRGRYENWKRHANTKEHWEKIIDNAGFKVVNYKEFHSSAQIAMGELNIRTLLPAYNILYKKLKTTNAEVFQEFKDEWVSEINKLLTPFTDAKWLNQGANKPLYHAFFIQKK